MLKNHKAKAWEMVLWNVYGIVYIFSISWKEKVLLPGAQGHLGEEKHIILAVTPTTSLLITAIVQLT